ncbi:MAG: hypothetical protein ACXVCA_00640 [Bdellovibrio sp.]
MISEALTFLFTPTIPLAKKYGFLYQSIALGQRYKRCKKAWLPHLKNCQDLFTATVRKLPQKKSVVILGSAHLHEIPVHLLEPNFESITLVDIVHPLKHHLLAKRNTRVKLVTCDISCCLDKMDDIQSLEELQRTLQDLQSQSLFHFEADLIISANILSQLGLLPIESMERKLKRSLTIEEKDKICTGFAELHLKNLKNCSGKKLLYADREVLYRSPSNEIIYKGHYPVNFSGFSKIKDWNWMLAPLKEASKDYSIEMKIEAFEI